MSSRRPQAFLGGLLERVTAREGVYSHSWAIGELVILDNPACSTMRHATARTLLETCIGRRSTAPKQSGEQPPTPRLPG